MDELKAQAMLQELEEQRGWALTRCAELRAALVASANLLTEAKEEIESLKKRMEEKQ